MVAGLSDPDDVVALTRLCEMACDELEVSGVALVLTAPHTAFVVAASDETAAARAEQQLTAGEGPSVDAQRLDRPVLAADLLEAGQYRWPGSAPIAAEAGLAATFSFPLHLGQAHLGVLEAHLDHAQPLSETAVRRALFFARMATDLLLNTRQIHGKTEASQPEGHVLERGVEIYQAQGMLMVLLDVDLSQALARMRAHAFAQDQTLLQLARQIVAGRTFTEGEI